MRLIKHLSHPHYLIAVFRSQSNFLLQIEDRNVLVSYKFATIDYSLTDVMELASQRDFLAGVDEALHRLRKQYPRDLSTEGLDEII